MAIRLPFYYTEKFLNPWKVSVPTETAFWVDLQDTINNLIGRCNTLNSKSLPLVSGVVNQTTKGAALTKEEYDANLTKFVTAANLLIQNSGDQGVNPANTVSLILRGSKTSGLSAYERDTNCFTIQTFINTMNKLYV